MEFNPPTQDGSRNYQGGVTNYSWEFTGSTWPEPGTVSISQILLYLASEGTRRKKPQNTHGRFRQLTQNPPIATVKSVTPKGPWQLLPPEKHEDEVVKVTPVRNSKSLSY